MITVNWVDPEKTLLVWHFGRIWSRADFLPACYKARRMLNEVSHTVNILVDLSLSRQSPPNVVNLALTGMKMHTENTGQIVAIISSQFWLKLYQYISRVYKSDSVPVEFVDSYGDAMQVLQRPYYSRDVPTEFDPLPAYTGSSVSPFVG